MYRLYEYDSLLGSLRSQLILCIEYCLRQTTVLRCHRHLICDPPVFAPCVSRDCLSGPAPPSPLRISHSSDIPKSLANPKAKMGSDDESNGSDGDVFSEEMFVAPLKKEIDAVSFTPRRRRVRFNKRMKFIRAEEGCFADDEDNIRWWTKAELEEIRQGAKDLSTSVRRTPGEGDDLTMAHHKTTLVLKTDFRGLARLSEGTPDHDLRKWCANDDGRRGLERYSSRDYSCFRRKDINSTRDNVLAEQKKQRSYGVVDERILSRVARDASRRARTFAHYFGEADAKQARAEEAAAARASLAAQPQSHCSPPRKRTKTTTSNSSMVVVTAQPRV